MRGDLERVRREVREELLARRSSAGAWRGHLSSSALATAVACFALHLAGRHRGSTPELNRLMRRGLDWLAANAQEGGGWGDTVRSRANLPTTLLARAALSAAGSSEVHRQALEGAETFIAQKVGSTEPRAVEQAVVDLYGKDRTFSVPILTLCTLAGTQGKGTWRRMPALPFELAVLPRALFRFVGLPVVSYALPALIAVGLVQHVHHPRRPFASLRNLARRPTLRLLEGIQPESGGFLEAIPLTAFVTMSLLGAGETHHPVVDRGLAFLTDSVRPNGAWPIDIDLATWVTTLAITAFENDGTLDHLDDHPRLRRWLLDQQYKGVHPFTGAAPGGWAWTDLPGGVPDADDTPGALLALRALVDHPGAPNEEASRAAEAGLRWLLDLQNRDGGLPTFCRGWGHLPFDRSSPDLTAHFLRAAVAWRKEIPSALQPQLHRGINKALAYLRRTQHPDGSWVPLWFGNEHAPENENPTYGTARVLRALTELRSTEIDPQNLETMATQAQRFLLASQGEEGGWGGAPGTPQSLEETALAVDALAGSDLDHKARESLRRGTRRLLHLWDRGAWRQATPIGFYFANLWYFEEMYPLTFLLTALGRASRHQI